MRATVSKFIRLYRLVAIKSCHTTRPQYYQLLFSPKVISARIFSTYSCHMSSESSKDLFSGSKIAEAYSQFRPVYGENVFSSVTDYCKGSRNCEFELAVDVACGSGQSTLPLAHRYKKVLGVDVSQQQIKQADSNTKPPNLSFMVGPAEDLSFLQDSSVDLITCAQGIHWLNLEKFYVEVERVLKPGAVLAAYGYGIWRLDIPEAESIVREFYDVTLGPYWGTGRKHVEQHYSQISLPFPGWKRDDTLEIQKEMKVDDFCGYISSWSAYHKYKEKYPHETHLHSIHKRLKELYSGRKEAAGPDTIDVRWPIFLLLGRKPE